MNRLALDGGFSGSPGRRARCGRVGDGAAPGVGADAALEEHGARAAEVATLVVVELGVGVEVQAMTKRLPRDEDLEVLSGANVDVPW